MKHLPPLIINIFNGAIEYICIDEPNVLDITGCEYVGILSMDKTIHATSESKDKYVVIHDVEAMTNARKRSEHVNILILHVLNRVLFIVDEGRETHLEIKN